MAPRKKPASLFENMQDALFLACASYEPRSTAVTDMLPDSYHSRAALIYVNKEFLRGEGKDQTNAALETMKRVLASHCDQVHVAQGSWLDPACQLAVIKEKLNEILLLDLTQEGSITLDCTTFNREALIICCTVVKSLFKAYNWRVAYASPQGHGSWLSRGFRGVRNIMGFSGVQHPEQPTILVILSGFEDQRTIRLIEEHEPSKVLLGIGDPPTDAKFLNRNKQEQKLILARQDVEGFDFPANAIEDCLNYLESLLSQYLPTCNIVLAPMSTKLSTLACMLAARRHPQIQLTYSLPGEYNTKDYSTGVKQIFIEELPKDQSIAE